MASVYILFSQKLKRFYTGSCEDVSYRLNQHWVKEFPDSYSAMAEDWELFLQIDDLEYRQCRAIENHIKKMKSVTYIQNLKKYPEIMEKLKMKYKI